MMEIDKLFSTLGVKKKNSGAFNGVWLKTSGSELEVHSPVDGRLLSKVVQAGADDYDAVIQSAEKAFGIWSALPAPARGDIVRQIGLEFRKYKDELGTLVALEMGKIKAEGDGEIQEIIDICDFAVGLSRQLYGLTMHSERPQSRMYEQWHPFGLLGLITSFNFPAAVWGWNFAIAAVCGDVTIWKPSSKVPLTALACTNIAQRVLNDHGFPGAVASLVVGRGKDVGERLIADHRIPLISATGSIPMGMRIAQVVGARLGRTILELGGNNAVIVSGHADVDMAIKGVFFGAVGTAGQRCTSTRRLIVHESIYEDFKKRLVERYKTIKIGDPLDPSTIMGPLIDRGAVEAMQSSIQKVRQEGGRIVYGGEILPESDYPGGCYVVPCIAEAENHYPIVQEETFAPLVYLMKFRHIEEALAMQNCVPQGLSSAIFSHHLREVELFLSHKGSDCGIANVNTSTSGAEIGGAFGGEKQTGGGRESGSDAWKYYMRRQTTNINWGADLPLAQGIRFD
jgi:aldehyde dehydrogenase (NAD+)